MEKAEGTVTLREESSVKENVVTEEEVQESIDYGESEEEEDGQYDVKGNNYKKYKNPDKYDRIKSKERKNTIINRY
jgi:hypothetical protein